MLFVSSFFVGELRPGADYTATREMPTGDCVCNGKIKLGGRFFPTINNGAIHSFERAVITSTLSNHTETLFFGYTKDDPPSAAIKTLIFDNKCGGSYKWTINVGKINTTETVTVTKARGTFMLTRGGPTPQNVTISNNNSPYQSGATVSLVANTTTTGPNLSYLWTGPIGQTIKTNPAVFTADPSTNGTWSLAVSTDNGGIICSANSITTFVQLACDLAITGTSASPACNGLATGEITVSYSGGTADIYYSTDGGVVFNPTPVSSNPFMITGLAGGLTYDIQLKDSSSPLCFSTVTPVFVPINIFGITNLAPTPACNGIDNGTITVSYQGGVAPIYYFINSAGPFTAGPSGFVIPGLSANTYSIQLMDSSYTPCFTSIDTAIVETDSFTVTQSATASCAAQNNGTITLTVNGGTSSSYTFQVDNQTIVAPSSATFMNIAGGISYPYSVADQYCTVTGGVFVPADNLSVSSSSTPTCPGQDVGSITLNAVGGAPDYTYHAGGNHFGPTAATTHTFSGLAVGGYIVSIEDGNGCISHGGTLLITSDTFTVSASSTPSCIGEENGTITLAASGGFSPYTFQVDNQTTVDTSSATFMNIAGGVSYPYSVEDQYCTVTGSVAVEEISCVATLSIFDCCASKISSTGIVTYTVSIKNTGMTTANDIQLIDALPPCLSYINASGSTPGWSFEALSSGQVIGKLGSLDSGMITTVVITARADCRPGRRIKNVLTVSGANVTPSQTVSCRAKVN